MPPHDSSVTAPQLRHTVCPGWTPPPRAMRLPTQWELGWSRRPQEFPFIGVTVLHFLFPPPESAASSVRSLLWLLVVGGGAGTGLSVLVPQQKPPQICSPRDSSTSVGKLVSSDQVWHLVHGKGWFLSFDKATMEVFYVNVKLFQ